MLSLAPGVVDLIKDINGHHVIQHCLKNFSAQQNENLLHEVAHNCFDIATDKSGCCVLQQCVDFSEGEVRERLLFNIITDALQLAEDPYGSVDSQLNLIILFLLIPVAFCLMVLLVHLIIFILYLLHFELN